MNLAVLISVVLPAGLVAAAGTRPQAFNRYEQLPLAPAAREYIAAVEHRALILNSTSFPAIARAVQKEDAKQLRHFLSPTFQGVVVQPTNGTLTESRVVKIYRASGDKSQPVDGETFVSYLLERRARFGHTARAKLSLMSLSPRERGNLKGGWQGSVLLELRGECVDGAAGETISTISFELATIPDVERICTEGKWIQAMQVVDLQESRTTQPLFKEVAKERGIATEKFTDTWTMFPPGTRPIVTGGVYLADINNDDFEDILVTDIKGAFLFLGSASGRFTDVTRAMELPSDLPPAANAAFGDFDNDGFVDLVLDYRVFRNENGRRFVEVTSRTGLRLGAGTGLTVVDYDHDGLLDLYFTRSFGMNVPRNATNSWIDGPGGPGNQLWRNMGDWKFQDVSRAANATAGRLSCFTAAWMDANNDGWPDVYAINEFGGGVLLVNSGKGTFRQQPLIDDVGDFGSMGLAVADYNNDGWIDVFTANMYSKSGRRVMENLPEGSYEPKILAKMKRFVTGSEMYLNQGQLQFQRQGQALKVHRVGWSYGPAFIDVDNDGFLDLYGTAGFASVNRDEPDG